LVGDRAKLLVAPHLVEKCSLLSAVNDVFNAVSVTGSAVGEVVFYGQARAVCRRRARLSMMCIEILKTNPMRNAEKW
jgi:homoserine dehydrogenase